MDFCSIYFGKTLQDLNYNDVENFFSEERIESDQIEFKSIKFTGNIEEKIDTIIENVCAFLNSDGGLIIWGAPEGVKKQGKEERYFGALTPNKQLIEKDKFINKVSSRITPLPYGINIKPLESNNNFIYIIEIQKSEYSPHQTNHKYYMRLDGQTRNAPHHYIEALFRKIKFPNIEAYIRVQSIIIRRNVNFNSRNGDYYEISLSFFIFNWTPFQNEELVYLSIFIDKAVFSNYSRIPNIQYEQNGHLYNDSNFKKILSYGDPAELHENVLIHLDDLIKNGYKLPILLTFGGKYSPVKYSFYDIDFSNIDESNFNNSLIPIYRNTLYKDLQNPFEDDKNQTLENLNLK